MPWILSPVITRLSRLAAVAKRLLVIALATLAFVPSFVAMRLFGSRRSARALRAYFQRCGGGFVKLGQFLSTRYDLLSAEYCAELAHLLDSAGVLDTRVVIGEIERGLGANLHTLFADFNPTPIAAASIAQVHAVTLHPDIAGVVKVQRPDIRLMLHVDFALLGAAARLLDVAARRPHYRQMVREAAAAIEEELDFRREARNCHRMYELMGTDRVRHHAPRVFLTHSCAQVLTLERIHGISVKEMIAAIDAQDRDQLAVWATRGITPERIARRLLISVLTQTMRHRFFHGDPHPANLIVQADGSLAWVDFGMTGWLDDRTWIQQFRLRDAIARRDLHRAYESLLDTLEPLPVSDLRAFEQTVEGVMQDWIIASATPGASIVEKSSGYFLVRTFEAIRRAGMRMPTRLMRLYRTMMIADMVMLKLDPTIDWVPILRQFIDAETRRQARHLSSSPMLPSFVDSVQAVLRIPAASIRLVDWLNTRLPRYGRIYERQMSVFEAAALAAVRFARGVAAAALIAAIVLAGTSAVIGPIEVAKSVHTWQWPFAIGAVAVYVWSSLTLRAMRN